MKGRNMLGLALGVFLAVTLIVGLASSQGAKEKSKETVSSYAPVVLKESFGATMSRMQAEKSKVMARQMELLKARYDLSNRPAKGVTMEDTVEFFNLVQGLNLNEQEKKDLTAFLRTL